MHRFNGWTERAALKVVENVSAIYERISGNSLTITVEMDCGEWCPDFLGYIEEDDSQVSFMATMVEAATPPDFLDEIIVERGDSFSRMVDDELSLRRSNRYFDAYFGGEK